MSTLSQAVSSKLNTTNEVVDLAAEEVNEDFDVFDDEIATPPHGSARLDGSTAAPSGWADDAAIERVLTAHQISTSASTPAPSQLHATRLQFHGTKILTGVTAAGEPTDPQSVEEVPFRFDWTLATGLNGVGSDRNLRGKSSVLRVLMWALRGRCDLQPEVRNWIDHVEFNFTVDADQYRVVFDVIHDDHHYPHGALVRTRHGVTATVGSFTRPDEFEEVMGGAMMQALGLPAIAAQTEGQRTQHVWPTYAGALIIRGDTLDNLLGEVSFAGLPSRLLSMFVGAEWAAARAEATTAVSIAKAKLTELENATSRYAAAMSGAHQDALDAVAAARVKLKSINMTGIDPTVVVAALARVPELDAKASQLSKLLRGARSDHAEAAAHLKVEQARRHQELEDAVAVRFFQNLKPTVCPRCSAPVTAERIEAESSGDACSVCTTGLDMHAHDHQLVLSSTVSEGDRVRLEQYIGLSTGSGTEASSGDANVVIDDDIEDIVDDLVALVEATNATEKRAKDLAEQLQTVEDERDQQASVIEANSEAQTVAQQKQQALIDLARAEGAATALAPVGGPVGPDKETMDALRAELRILEAAQSITTKWVQDGQRQRLEDLSSSIVQLARSFGMPNLTGIKLGGGATMHVTKGGSTTPYGRTERGEKLRLKLATAIALIQQGRDVGIGRHPGLLIVDSPGAEEISDDDFDTMLEALHREASASDIQVFVGTCHTEELVKFLGEGQCRLGRGNNFVW